MITDAKWINPELKTDKDIRYPASVLKKSFNISDPAGAVLRITCHGLYVVKINGSRVGDFVLAPGTDTYNKRLQYQEYDVSALLSKGENEICVTLGDGWYRGCGGIEGQRNFYGGDLALLCELECADGETIISDESWLSSQSGPVRYNDLQMGECYDARMEEISDWHSVKVESFDKSALILDRGVPVTENERFPGRIFTAPNGETVVDFGRNLAGYTELCLNAKGGERITLRHGETLDENGNFTQANYRDDARHKFGGVTQRTVYICKPGLNIYKPSFAIYGFRYAKIETDADLTGAEFTSIAVYSRMRQTAFFECSDSRVTKLFENSLWSMKSNFCDVPTDCPTRERAGWTGDAGVFASTAVKLMDCRPVLRKWLANCRLNQRSDGTVVNISPLNRRPNPLNNFMDGSTGWGDACIIVPWEIYKAYNDISILSENYAMMCRWVQHLSKQARTTRPKNLSMPGHRYIIDTGFHWGEWCEPGANDREDLTNIIKNGTPESATAYFYHSTNLLSKIAGILGFKDDETKYSALAEKIRDAYRQNFVPDGRIHSEKQARYARPVKFGLLDKDEIPAAAADLEKLVRENDYHLNTGFLSTPFLCPVLAENGYIETAYRLLLQNTCPSWLYEVEKGATSIWENWDGINEEGKPKASLNHYSYGAVSDWLISGVCGINVSAGSLVIRPQPSRQLEFAGASLECTFGTVKSGWRYEEDKLIIDVEIPAGIAADIILPDGTEYKETSGIKQFIISDF